MAEKKSYPRCGDFGGVSRQTGKPCGQAAGRNTDHPGTGKCSIHGGCSKGRPPKNGKYCGLPGVLNEDYLKRLDDPALKSLDDETAVTEALIAQACRDLGEGGMPDWALVASAFDKLEKATVGMDKDGFMESMDTLRKAIDAGKRFANTRDVLLELFGAKASLVEKSARVEERLGLFTSTRDLTALIAWFGHFIAEEAARNNDPEILRRFKADLARKGAFAAPGDGRDQPPAFGGPN